MAVAKVESARERGLVSTMAQATVERDTTSCNAAMRTCEKGEEWQFATGQLSTMAVAKVESARDRGLGSTMAQDTVERAVYRTNPEMQTCTKE